MNILREIQSRFAAALTGLAENPADLVGLIRPSQDAKFGDYQANLAMPLGKQLGKPPRDVAAEIISRLKIDDLCQPPEIAGPGFINLRLHDNLVATRASAAATDPRSGVPTVAKPRTFVIDYSAPNVAKPMHVGHIRSTVIGDSLYRTVKFLGHKAISDNHLGDWGTQFGMIIYGYKHFLDKAALEKSPIDELARLYRLVSTLVGYFEGRERLTKLLVDVKRHETAFETHKLRAASGDPKADKKAEKEFRQAERALHEARNELRELDEKLTTISNDPLLSKLVDQHADIPQAVLRETAKLHAGDAENLGLWKQFMPNCIADIERIYKRLGVTFDHTLGESFYHDQLAGVVDSFVAKGIARESDGAMCIFIPGQEVPFLIRKKDGAFLYATTDLATIAYRMKTWRPDAILYVVDHRQSLHFEQLFAAAKLWGFGDTEYSHVAFGTVLGQDGRPYKTRSGDTVGLWGLLDEGVSRALKIVSENDEGKKDGPELSADERQHIAEVVGIGALKYADLSQNRTSDYVFDYDKMLAMTGNTATYMQYAHARIRGIFNKGQQQLAAEPSRAGNGEVASEPSPSGRGQGEGAGNSPSTPTDRPNLLPQTEGAGNPLATPTQHPHPNPLPEGEGVKAAKIILSHSAERALALANLRFAEALDSVLAEYRPNQLTNYLFELANSFSGFYENCPVLRAETPELLASRLALCGLTANVLKQGLALLGINVVERM